MKIINAYATFPTKIYTRKTHVKNQLNKHSFNYVIIYLLESTETIPGRHLLCALRQEQHLPADF